MAGFEVEDKIDALLAYDLYPQHRLRQLDSGEIIGNIIITPEGRQHPLDTHDPSTFGRRIQNYVTGRNAFVLNSPREIQSGREDTSYVLSYILGKRGERRTTFTGAVRRWMIARFENFETGWHRSKKGIERLS